LSLNFGAAMNRTLLPLVLCAAFACALSDPIEEAAAATDQKIMNANPLASPSPLQFEAPPYDRLKDSAYRAAIESAMKRQRAEIKAIDADKAPPTFDNTIVALERSGIDLTRVTKIFFNLTSSNNNPRLQAIKTAVAPEYARHGDAITLDPRLFARIKVVYDESATLGLDAVSLRLTERYYTRFVRAGALLDHVGKARLKRLNEEESKLTTAFTDHILKEVAAKAIVVDRKEDLDGLSDADIDAAREAAEARKLKGKWVIALQNTTTQPPLASLRNRALRERIYKASIARNFSGPYDNRPILLRLAALRAERARLFGFSNWAAYVTADQMAKTPEAAEKLLADMAPAAANNAKREAAKLQALIDQQNGGFKLQPWDWDFYAEQVRRADYDLDEASIKPYFELETVLHDGLFFAAHEMYGLGFKERRDLPVYQPDVRVFEVSGSDGIVFALIYFDFYQHDGKNGGAWMDTLVDQNRLLDQHPVVINNLNIVKPAAGQRTLMSFDEVTAMFHEFGHGLHGLLSNQTYPFFSGANTTTDFVEFPSQFNENWALDPKVFANYAKHYSSGAPMPQDLVDKIVKSRKFNQGYGTTEYVAAALLDLEWHSRGVDAPPVKDIEAFEHAALAKYGLDLPQVPPRYKTAYFSHIWDGGYSANYYAYMWADVLAIDGFQWFVEHGGMTRENGMHYRATVLSQGGSKDAGQLYRDFAGRDPSVEPLLERRGLK
jgi:peptidyl-dipeptidase Dcp